MGRDISLVKNQTRLVFGIVVLLSDEWEDIVKALLSVHGARHNHI